MVNLKNIVNKSSQLWLKWGKVTPLENNSVKLHDVVMYGEVLNDCSKIDKAGFIYLDFTMHYIVLLTKPYIVKLTWDSLLTQDTEAVNIESIIIEDQEFGFMNQLKNTDRILLDCSGHTTEEEERGHYLAAYRAMLYNEYLEPYEFINKK